MQIPSSASMRKMLLSFPCKLFVESLRLMPMTISTTTHGTTTCKTTFHGSCCSVLQSPTPDNQGTTIGPECILNPDVMGKKGIDILPQSYTNMADDVSLTKSKDYHVPDLELNSWLKPLWISNPVCKRVQEALHTGMLYGWLHSTMYLSWPLLWEATCSMRLYIILGNFLCSIVYVLILNYDAVHFYDFVYIFIDHHMSDRNIVML